MENIQKVLELEGGNNYKEGRAMKRGYRGRRRVGYLFKHAYIQDSEEAYDEEDYEDWRVSTDPTDHQNTRNDGDEVESLTSESCTTCSTDSID